MLPAVIPSFAVHSETPSAKRQKVQPKCGSPSYEIPDDGSRMASVVDFCMMLGLRSEAQVLINLVKEDLHCGDCWWLRHVLMPFLIDLASAMEKHNTGFTERENQNLFQQGISLFIAKHVGPKPEGPKDWALPGMGCSCNDCWYQLEPFLRSPDTQHFEFTATGQRRDHLCERLGNEPSVRKTTRKNARAPHTLVLDKTRDGYNEVLEAWNKRRDEAKSLMGCIKNDILRKLLADKYSDLTELRHVVPEEDTVGSSRKPLAVTQTPASVMRSNGAKPFVEIIDLEESLI